MNEVSTYNSVSENFIVNKETGAISISQRKCAELLGIALSSVNERLSKEITNRTAYLIDSKREGVKNKVSTERVITEEIFFTMVEYYAFESKAKNETALTLYKQIAKAGTRAYLYAQAGYTFTIAEVKQDNVKMLSNEEYKSEVRKIKLDAQREKLQLLKDTNKCKLDELKNKVYTRIKLLNEKHARILAKNEIKIKADMTVSKEHLPHDTLTNLLKKHGVKMKPIDFNNLLIKHGYLMPNRHEVTEKGTFFGHTVKSSTTVKTLNPRWYISEFGTLLDEIMQVEPTILF